VAGSSLAQFPLATVDTTPSLLETTMLGIAKRILAFFGTSTRRRVRMIMVLLSMHLGWALKDMKGKAILILWSQ
jgi:hypothetical protein